MKLQSNPIKDYHKYRYVDVERYYLEALFPPRPTVISESQYKELLKVTCQKNNRETINERWKTLYYNGSPYFGNNESEREKDRLNGKKPRERLLIFRNKTKIAEFFQTNPEKQETLKCIIITLTKKHVRKNFTDIKDRNRYFRTLFMQCRESCKIFYGRDGNKKINRRNASQVAKDCGCNRSTVHRNRDFYLKKYQPVEIRVLNWATKNRLDKEHKDYENWLQLKYRSKTQIFFRKKIMGRVVNGIPYGLGEKIVIWEHNPPYFIGQTGDEVNHYILKTQDGNVRMERLTSNWELTKAQSDALVKSSLISSKIFLVCDKTIERRLLSKKNDYPILRILKGCKLDKKLVMRRGAMLEKLNDKLWAEKTIQRSKANVDAGVKAQAREQSVKESVLEMFAQARAMTKERDVGSEDNLMKITRKSGFVLSLRKKDLCIARGCLV